MFIKRNACTDFKRIGDKGSTNLPATCNDAVEDNSKLQWHILMIYPPHYRPELHVHIFDIFRSECGNFPCYTLCKISMETMIYRPCCILHGWVILLYFAFHMDPGSSCISQYYSQQRIEIWLSGYVLLKSHLKIIGSDNVNC